MGDRLRKPSCRIKGTFSTAETSSLVALDLAEQVSRALRSNEETWKSVVEQKGPMAEAAKLNRDRALAPWQIGVAGMAAGASFIKLIGS